MLELVNVSKSYKDQKVVSDLSFSVDKGQVLGLVGANGAGKSTCVSMIATLIKPDSGQILFNGQDIVKDPDAIRRKLGYVPQDIALYETLSGLDNLKFWGKSYGVGKEHMDTEIKRVCDIISFDSTLLKKRVSEYSGGMKRRLNIGVALLHRPESVKSLTDISSTLINMDKPLSLKMDNVLSKTVKNAITAYLTWTSSAVSCQPYSTTYLKVTFSKI